MATAPNLTWLNLRESSTASVPLAACPRGCEGRGVGALAQGQDQDTARVENKQRRGRRTEIYGWCSERSKEAAEKRKTTRLADFSWIQLPPEDLAESRHSTRHSSRHSSRHSCNSPTRLGICTNGLPQTEIPAESIHGGVKFHVYFFIIPKSYGKLT